MDRSLEAMIHNADFKRTEEIRKQGIEPLASALGPIDAVRFLQIFDLGKCDYT